MKKKPIEAATIEARRAVCIFSAGAHAARFVMDSSQMLDQLLESSAKYIYIYIGFRYWTGDYPVYRIHIAGANRGSRVHNRVFFNFRPAGGL